MNKINRIHELVLELNQYRHEYYNLSKPTISDLMYDTKLDELSGLEQETGLVLSVSPTQNVGYTVVSKLNKVQHSIPLLSLEKTKSIDDILKFRGNHDMIAMLKADGLTVKLDYDLGILQQGSTRGNSIIGEDVTFNVKQFKNIPLTIPYKGKLTVVGEAIIHYNDFEMINSKLPEGEKYKNPRNLTSGSVRQLDSKECANRHVNFYAFGILECDAELSDSKYDRFKWLGEQGFTTISSMKLSSNIDISHSKMEVIINQMRDLADDLKLGIDGLVFSFNSVKYSSTLKSTSHHPLHSLAFKFENEIVETILRDIEWSLGKNQITPVAIFDPIELCGTTVSRASLHNISIMEELEIGIGDSIGIIKANEIIPKVEENYTRSNNIHIPVVCPVCSGNTEIKQDNQSKVLICTNDSCDGKFLKKLSHFVSRDAMNIDGLGESVLEKFIEQGFISKFDDIYKLEQYKSQIIKIEGMGAKSYSKIMSAIEKSKDTEMYRVIYSMSIPNIGRSASKAIAKYFDYDMDNFLGAISVNFNFTAIEDFGEITNDSIYSWFDKNRNELIDVLAYVNIKKPEIKKDNNLKDLSGLTFVVTGSVETYKNRKELEELISSLSGKLSSGVSKATNFLINNDITSTSGKNQKANELNISIISEDSFNKMIGRIV